MNKGEGSGFDKDKSDKIMWWQLKKTKKNEGTNWLIGSCRQKTTNKQIIKKFQKKGTNNDNNNKY